jgi:hypothetical protein
VASWKDRDARIAQYFGIVTIAWRLSKAFVASIVYIFQLYLVLAADQVSKKEKRTERKNRSL